MNIFRKIMCAAAVIGVLPFAAASVSPARAQTGEHGDWLVNVAGEGQSRICWVVSSPVSKAAFRGGKTVQVNRGDIFLTVSIRPADGVKNEVSYNSGYPFKSESEVEIAVGSKKLKMFTGDGDVNNIAWLTTPEDDDVAVNRFRSGATAKIKGLSARGTTTVDTFSLKGFTAALKDAGGKCGA